MSTDHRKEQIRELNVLSMSNYSKYYSMLVFLSGGAFTISLAMYNEILLKNNTWVNHFGWLYFLSLVYFFIAFMFSLICFKYHTDYAHYSANEQKLKLPGFEVSYAQFGEYVKRRRGQAQEIYLWTGSLGSLAFFSGMLSLGIFSFYFFSKITL